MARARTGDQAAFRELVRRYEGLVAATVRGMLGTGPESEDVGQSTFIRFFEALHQYRGDGGVAPFLTRIAINLSLNALDKRKRRRWRFPALDSDDPESEPAVDDASHLDVASERELIQKALQRLTPDHRAVIVLRLIDGYSTRETADLLQVPVGTVLSRLSRAQLQLKNLLQPYLQEL